MQKVNIKQLDKYKNIFGTAKMLALWKDFVNQAEDSWQKMGNVEWDTRRYIFHNWRSGSKIFGLEDFSGICQNIEENILTHRFSKAEKQIQTARLLYLEAIGAVDAIFSQTEISNEK